MQTVLKIPNYKIVALVVGMFMTFMIMIGRLGYLQIYLNDQFSIKSQKNFLRFETIRPPRGNIIDAHGTLLATNQPVHTLVWCGSGKQNALETCHTLLEKLSMIINKPLLEDAYLMKEMVLAERFHRRVVLAEDLSFDKVCQIEEMFPGCEQLCIETEFRRFYPYTTCASHVLGYLGNIKVAPSGCMGIEQEFEQDLKGQQGTKQKTINSLGKSLAVQTIQDALAGKDIQTTLDLSLQKLVEEVFPADYRGACVVMNPKDGSLVAVVSRPSFDPNVFLMPLMPDEWLHMQEGQLFLNRVFNVAYPPGSIFKLVTTAAALQEGIISPETRWTCCGHTMFANRKYLCQCTKTWGKDELTAQQALARSCNTFFYEIGKKIPIDTLARYAHAFGLGQKTTVHFPEKTGLIPTSQWKMKVKGERWWPGETLSATIGQSFILVTPIQVARLVASIFTGYLVTPRIVAHEPVVRHPLTIHTDTLSFLRDSMRAVVTQGTGRRMNRIKDLEIYAKTSTAQTSGLDKRKLGIQHLEHGWFAAYFSYKHHEPLVLVFLVENAGSSRVTAMLAKKFLLGYTQLMDDMKI